MKRRDRWKYLLFITGVTCFGGIYIPGLWSKDDGNNINPDYLSTPKKGTYSSWAIDSYESGKDNENLIEEGWQVVGDTNGDMYIYSAYYDERDVKMPVIKLIGVTRIKSQNTFMCRINFIPSKKVKKIPGSPYNDSRTHHRSNSDFVDVPATVSLMNEHHNHSYSACYISCNISGQSVADDQSIPKLVSIVLKSDSGSTVSNLLNVNDLRSIRIERGSEITDIGVCVKPLHSYYNQTLDLVEFIEFNRILGVSKFTFYNQSMSKDISCVLNYYSEQNDTRLSVRSWNLRKLAPQIEVHDEAGMAAVNDCLYRNMNDIHYLLMIDLDEFIVPHMNDTLKDMLKFLNLKEVKMKTGRKVASGELASSYNFKNAFFYHKKGDEPTYESENEDNPSIPLRVLMNTRRSSTFNPLGDRSKYICIPNKVKEAGIHFVWEYQKGIPLHVPTNMGFVHHYRNGCELHNGETKENCANEKYQIDKHAHKFKYELIKNVENVWIKLSEKCNLDPILSLHI